MLVDDVEQGIAVVDAYAAEHLEIQTAAAEQVAGRITNAGAIFVGLVPGLPRRLLRRQRPRAAHRRLRLPLLGPEREELPQGRAPGPLHRDALAEVASAVEVFADAEDLPAHGAAVTRRFAP